MNNYKSSLRKRPQFGEMINEIELDQPIAKLPDRRATFLRNTHFLSQFDGDQSFISLEEQQNKMLQQKVLEAKMRQMGRAGQGLPNMFYRAAASESGGVR